MNFKPSLLIWSWVRLTSLQRSFEFFGVFLYWSSEWGTLCLNWKLLLLESNAVKSEVLQYGSLQGLLYQVCWFTARRPNRNTATFFFSGSCILPTFLIDDGVSCLPPPPQKKKMMPLTVCRLYSLVKRCISGLLVLSMWDFVRSYMKREIRYPQIILVMNWMFSYPACRVTLPDACRLFHLVAEAFAHICQI